MRSTFRARTVNPYAGPAVGVKARLVYFAYDDINDDGWECSEPLIAAIRDCDADAHLRSLTQFHGHTGSPDWEDHHLHGADEPYLEWPDLREIHVVSSGGVGNGVGDTGLDPTGLAVFADLPSAEAFARRHGRPSVVVRTVPLGDLLPVVS